MDKYMTPGWISVAVLAGVIGWTLGLIFAITWVCLCVLVHAWYYSWSL